MLVAAGPLLVYPLEAQAQDTATFKCEFIDKYSLATIENRSLARSIWPGYCWAA